MESTEIINTPVSIGQLLSQAREKKGVTLSEAAAATYLLEKHLTALEKEKWDELPESTYVRGYLRSYARYLNLDVADVIVHYDQIEHPNNQSSANDVPNIGMRYSIPEFKHSPKSAERQIKKRLIWLFALMLLAFAVIAGALFLIKISPWHSLFIPQAEKVVHQVKPVPAVLPVPQAVVPERPDNTQDSIGNKIDSIIDETPVVQKTTDGMTHTPPPPAVTPVAPVKPAVAVTQAATPTTKTAVVKNDQIEVVLGQQSLVTIFDKYGNVLFTGIETPEKKIRVAGQSPFTVLIPRAEGVRMRLNNLALDPSSRIKAGSLELRIAP